MGTDASGNEQQVPALQPPRSTRRSQQEGNGLALCSHTAVRVLLLTWLGALW